jgi:alpha-D-ribose 1-methylphosphonate 5-phosphate C-P lyase
MGVVCKVDVQPNANGKVSSTLYKCLRKALKIPPYDIHESIRVMPLPFRGWWANNWRVAS